VGTIFIKVLNDKNRHHSFCPLEQNTYKIPFFLYITPKNTMKKIYFLTLIFLVTIGISNAQLSSARVMTPGDPNLDPNWDWTLTMPGQGHQMHYSTAAGQILTASAQTPFRMNGEDFFAYSETVADMYKEDGWMLVARDFGTPTVAPRLPFFILYNKYRGILRVFALNVNGLSNSLYQMRLGFRTTSPKPAVFTLSGADPSKRFLDNFDSNGFLRYLGVSTPGGWYYGEFNLAGYDPNISVNTVFRLELDGINSSAIQLNGSIALGGTVTLQGIIQGRGNLSGYYPSSGSNSTGFLNKGEKYFKSTSEVFEAVGKITAKKGSSSFLAATAAVPKVGPVIKAVGSILALINTFIGGNEKNTSREPISLTLDLTQDASFRGNILLEGMLNLSGTIETNLPIFKMDFAMSTSNPVAEVYKPVQSIPWGVMNLKSSSLETIITNEVITIGSYLTPGNNCSYYCPSYCNYSYVYEEQFVWLNCNCSEELVCEQIEVFYPIIERDFKHRIRLNYNPSLAMSIASVRLVYRMTEYELPITLISASEIELTTPSFNYVYGSINGDDPFTNIPFPQYIIVFFKINSPVRNADDEVVIVEKILFSNEQISYQAGGRMETIPEFKFEKQNIEPQPPMLSFPNPTKGSSKIEFSVEQSGNGNLQIFDLNGNHIRTLINNQAFKQGRYRMFWNGMDAKGESIPPGLYICKFSVGGQSKNIRVVKSQ